MVRLMAASIVLAMPESAGARLVAGAHWWARFSLALLIIGPSILLVSAWVEVLNNPGLSLVDGYLVGRLPWTPIGIVVSLTGGIGGLLAGSVAIGIEGGWWRRFLLLPAFAGAVLWWATALGVIPFPRFNGPDPVQFAFLLPATAALLLLMPAGLLATLCITPRRPSVPRTRMRPVPSVRPGPRTWLEGNEHGDDDKDDLPEPAP